MREEMAERSEFFELLGGLCEGTLTDERFAELDRMLAADPAARQSYVEYMLLCAGLRRYHVLHI